MSRLSKSSILPLFRTQGSQQPQNGHDNRLQRLSFLPNRVRNESIAFLGEFVGTFMFLFLAFAATQVANASSSDASSTEQGANDGSLTQAPNTSNLLFISLAFGFSLMINAWTFYRISGGLFNPAVTLGLLLIGALKPLRAFLFLIAQLLSSMAAAGIVSALFPGPLNVATTLGASTSIAQGLFIETFLTAELIFVIFMFAAEKHKATFLAPVAIGLALFVCELPGVYFTGGSLNPARSLGPAVVVKSFPGYHWIYWLGPCFGALLAYAFYTLMKFGEYQTANPGQDFDDHEARVFEPPADAVTAEEVARPNIVAETLEKVASGGSLSGSGGAAAGDSRVGSPLGQILSGGRASSTTRGVEESRDVGGHEKSSLEGERGKSIEYVRDENEEMRRTQGVNGAVYAESPSRPARKSISRVPVPDRQEETRI